MFIFRMCPKWCRSARSAYLQNLHAHITVPFVSDAFSRWTTTAVSFNLINTVQLFVFNFSFCCFLSLLWLEKVNIDETHVCLCVCVCLSVCVYFPHKRFLGNYHTHHHHQTWHGNCLRHDNASHVNCIDLYLHSRSQINILRKKDPRWKELVMWSIWDFLPHHIVIYILQKSSYFCSYVIEMSLRDNLVLCLWKMLKQLRHINSLSLTSLVEQLCRLLQSPLLLPLLLLHVVWYNVCYICWAWCLQTTLLWKAGKKIFFVFKVISDFHKVNVDETSACVCVCVCVCVSLASDSSETVEVIIIKLGTITASDMRIHHVLIILTLTSVKVMKTINVQLFQKLKFAVKI